MVKEILNMLTITGFSTVMVRCEIQLLFVY